MSIELKTSEVLTVCQQLVLTPFRYPNLSETTNGQRKEKYPSTTRTRTTGHSISGETPHLVFIQGWTRCHFGAYMNFCGYIGYPAVGVQTILGLVTGLHIN